MPRSFLELEQQQNRQNKHYLSGLLLLLASIFVLSLCSGEHWFWPFEWFDDDATIFIWQLRFPRMLAVMSIGAALACAGAVMQALFDNPLAEPGLLGISNGAGVVLVLCLILGGGIVPVWMLNLATVIGACVLTSLLLVFSAHQMASNARLLLMGVALSIICSAIMTLAVYFSADMNLRQLMYWMMGGFSGTDWRQIKIVISLLIPLSWLLFQGSKLNILALGQLQAQQLGLPLLFWRSLFLIAIGWIIGVSVAVAGIIGFVGLIVPHMLRLKGMTDHRTLLSGCALLGGAVLLLADMLARIAIRAAELPIGVVTAAFGAPLFVWMLLKRTM